MTSDEIGVLLTAAVVVTVTIAGLNWWVVNRTLGQLRRDIEQRLETLQGSVD